MAHTSICRHCGRPIHLARRGMSHKWVTENNLWKCPTPGFPVRAHEATRIKRSRFTGYDPIRPDDIEEELP